jgi:hypothetical protein
MVGTPDSLNQVETAAHIYVRIALEDGSTFEVPVSEIDFTKDVDVERVREMGMHPNGYAVNAIDVDGSLTFAGHRVKPPTGGEKDLDALLFNNDGTPSTFDVTIAHEDAGGNSVNGDEDEFTDLTGSDTLKNCIVTQSEFTASSGDSTESSYEFMAQRIN